MSFVLFVLGLAAAAAGVLMIGFGIPINEFSLGNTLIIAGTTALASGLVVLGLSVVARQLAKIAEILLSRPATPVPSRSSDMMEPAGGGGMRMPNPRQAMPAEAAPPPRAPAPAPVGFDPAEDLPPPPPPSPAPASRPRIPGFGSAPQPPAAEPNPPQRNWRPPGRPGAAEPARQEPSLGAPTPGAPARPAPAPEVNFDTVWPAPERRPDRIEPSADLRSEPPLAPAPRLNGDATRPAPSAPAAPENAPVSVLKSGVVDGMAYTLYTDGSIEAELAQGVVRFGSIEELRNHLEKGA
jgi:hypothetical protein